MTMTRYTKMIGMNGTELAKPLSDKERHEIEAAEKAAPVFDDDCPEMSAEQLAQLHRLTKKAKPDSGCWTPFRARNL